MIDLALIPARAGSIGLPGKNIRTLGGLPLIAWTIRAALQSELFERVVVTTDSAEIGELSRAHGAEIPFLRPAALATATATSADVVAHALETLEVTERFALLQPTSPFRSAQHLREAAMQFAGTPTLVSVVAAKPAAWLREIDAQGGLHALQPSKDIARRQDAAPTVLPNGAIYLAEAKRFLRDRTLLHEGGAGYRMGTIDSLDIDDGEDFELAEAVVATGLRRPD